MGYSIPWEKQIKPGGFISSVSIGNGYIAVLNPTGKIVHFYDVWNHNEFHKEYESLILSVAVIDREKALLAYATTATQLQASSIFKDIFNIVNFTKQKTIEIKWEETDTKSISGKELLFGKMVILPEVEGRKRAIVAGMADDLKTKGFLLVLEWSEAQGRGTINVLTKGIDEAPQDIAIKGENAYVATGRGSSIKLFNIRDKKELTSLSIDRSKYPDTVFKPMRIIVSSDYAIGASYNELFWWDDKGNFLAKREVCGNNDCINGMTILKDARLAFACTYSNRIRVRKLNPSLDVDEVSIEFERPCWVIADPDKERRIYVVSYPTGQNYNIIKAIDM